MKKFISFVLLCASLSALAAAPHQSNQNHSGSVTAMAVSGENCFTAGSDGFVIRWNGRGEGEQYQVSELKIAMLAVHPNGEDIAIYETNGFGVHRISVWNWRTQVRRYAKRFSDSISALSYTKKGTYLVVGTASVNGAIFLQSASGNQVRKISAQTGIVSMIESSDTEASCVMYSPTGHIAYYNLANGQQRARFSCEPNLSKTTLFGNNLFLAGFRDGTIFVIDALSGKTTARIPARNPFLFPSQNELVFVEQSGKSGSLKTIEARGNSVGSAIVIKNFSFAESAAVTSCAVGAKVFFGTASGNVYSATTLPEAAAVSPVRMTRPVYQKILDVAVLSRNIFCFLTASEVFVSDYSSPAKKTLAANGDRHTNMLTTENGAIVLWSKGTRKQITMLDPVSYNAKKIFTPKSNVTLVRAFGTNLIIIEGNSSVSLYPMPNPSLAAQIYKGTGIQDALLDDSGVLYIAKSAASNPPSPLIFVDTATRETVRLPLSGDVSYAMSSSESLVFGIALSSGNFSALESSTALFAYDTQSRNAQNIITYADDDVDAFTCVYDSVLYTNIGQTNVIAYNTRTRAQFQLERGFSLSKKITRNADYIAALAGDGSVVWYRANANQAGGGVHRFLSQWYLKADNEWEFNAAQDGSFALPSPSAPEIETSAPPPFVPPAPQDFGNVPLVPGGRESSSAPPAERDAEETELW